MYEDLGNERLPREGDNHQLSMDTLCMPNIFLHFDRSTLTVVGCRGGQHALRVGIDWPGCRLAGFVAGSASSHFLNTELDASQ